MSTNFEFLKDIKDEDYLRICGELYERCENAEEFVYSKPKLCVDECRVAAELTAKLFYKKRVGEYGKKKFWEILRDEAFRNNISEIGEGDKRIKNSITGRQMIGKFHSIRESGNPGHHGNAVNNPKLTAMANLQDLYKIMGTVFWVLKFIDHIDPYVEPPEEVKPIAQTIGSENQKAFAINHSAAGNGAEIRNGISPELPVLTGTVIIEPNLRSQDCDSLMLRASLKGLKVDSKAITYQWGFLKKEGGIYELNNNGAFFQCLPEKSINKIYRCEVTVQGYSGSLYGDYGPITEDSFLFPLMGQVAILGVAKQPDTVPDAVCLRAGKFGSGNFRGRPVFTWICGEKRSCTEQKPYLVLTESDIGKTFVCEISHPKRTGTVKSEPYVLTEEEFYKLKDEITETDGVTKETIPGNHVATAQNPEITQENVATARELETTQALKAEEENEKKSDVIPEEAEKQGPVTIPEEAGQESKEIISIEPESAEEESEEQVPETVREEIPSEKAAEQPIETIPEEIISEEQKVTEQTAETVREEILSEKAAEQPIETIPEEIISEEQKVIEQTAETVREEIPSEKAAEQPIETIPEEIISEEQKVTEQTAETVQEEIITEGRMGQEEPEAVTKQPEEQKTGTSISVKRTKVPEVIHAASVSAPNYRCFDSNVSRLHYLIAHRHEYYATNTFQYLDYNAFLYTMLKDQGYQRVIIVGNISEDEGDNYPVIAYDSLSQYSFLNPVDFEEYYSNHVEEGPEALWSFCKSYETTSGREMNPVRMQMGGRLSRATKSSSSTQSRYGKRVIRTIIREASGGQGSAGVSGNERKPKELFEAFITQEVNAAMKSEALKTAVVLPLELLLEHGYLTNAVVRTLNVVLNCPGNHVLIITTDQVEDLYRLYTDVVSEPFQKIDNTINKAISAIQGNAAPQAYCEAFVDELAKKGRILIAAETPGMDEIMNLFFALKLERPQDYQELPVSKIPALAEFIATKCNSTEHTQKALPELKNNTWYVGLLRNLEIALRDENVRKALFHEADGLWNRAVCDISNLLPAYVERFYAGANRIEEEGKAMPLPRSTMTEAERAAEYQAAGKELNELVGLKSVKDMLKSRFSAARFSQEEGPGHYIFAGNPGTGKTVVARLIGKILHAQGLLAKGHVVEVMKDDLVADHIGGSAIKTRKKCEEALDGVLFIDEAYQLVNTSDSSSQKFASSFDKEAYITLMAFMENNRKRLCVICAGYPYEMEKFRTADPGMSRRISKKNIIEFPDYSQEELYEILCVMAKQRKLLMSDGFLKAAKDAIGDMWEHKDKEFGNAGDIRNFLNECVDNASVRAVDQGLAIRCMEAEDIPKDYQQTSITEEEYRKLQTESMKKLNDMIGLQNVKIQIEKVLARQKVLQGSDRGPGHYIFAGNPGTGKTAVARIVGEIFKANGLLKKGHTVEVSKADLVAGYVGQTPIKTREQCMKALDGILFVDEAYELNPGSLDEARPNSFNEEAYNEIMTFMDNNRSRICVIFAGYKDEMKTFVDGNPGMERRITKVISFDDYSDDELMQILEHACKNYQGLQVEMEDGFETLTRKAIPLMRRSKHFGNAGAMMKYLDECVDNALFRLSKTEHLVRGGRILLKEEDVPEEYGGFIRSRESDLSSGERGIGSKQERNNQADMAAEQALPTGFGLISRSILEELPDPYKDVDIHCDDFPELCRESIVRIQTEFGSATAFVITPDGYAVTCAHAVSSKEDFSKLAFKNLKAYFRLEGSDKEVSIKFHIVNSRPDLDLALIKIEAEIPLPYLKLADENRRIKLGEHYRLYGFPNGRKGIMQFPGTISTEAEQGGTGELGDIRHISGDAEPGDSGGPIIAESDGCVIGVLRGAIGKHNFMKPIEYFWKEFLN